MTPSPPPFNETGMIPTDLVNRFDQYHRGELSKTEIKALKQFLQEDEQRLAYYEEYLALREGIKQHNRNQLKAKLKREAEKASSHLRVVRLRRNLAIAASVLVLLSAGFWLYQQNLTTDPGIAQVQDEEKTNFTQLSDDPASADPNQTLAENTSTTDEESTFEASEKKYQDAVALIAEGQDDEAISILKEIPTSSPNYHSLAQYELAKLYIQNQKLTEATQILTELINTPGDHYIKEDAQKLLRSLSIPTSIFKQH